MREVFKWKICERIGPGFLTSVEFLHRKVGWNAEGFSWTYDPKHTLAMADGFGFNGKKQLEQTKWKVTVAPESKTVGRGLRDGAAGLDEQETRQYRSLVGTAMCWTRQTRNTICNERSREIHVRSDACREVYAQTFVQVLQRGTRTQLEFSIDAADCGAVNCREWVNLHHEGWCSHSGGPQCYGGIWVDVRCGL